MSEEPIDRRERRRVLMELEAEIDGLPVHEVAISQLAKMKVLVQPMALDEKSDIKPLFFIPYQSYPELDDDAVERNYPDLGGEQASQKWGIRTEPVDAARRLELYLSDYTRTWKYIEYVSDPLWTGKCIGDYSVYKDLYQYPQPEFGVSRMTNIDGKEYPHSKVVSYNNLNGNDHELLRGELLIILRLMLGQLRKRRLLEHMMAPVLLFSLMGPQHARAIEAYYDGKNLILRTTKLYDFRTKNVQGLKDFAEWYRGNPIGDTTR
ncbi:uncharacterized protein N7459_006920 [Penicillium hispanicum]|uniref:uncharacterized protein n=1 Tax=Penicillium hispanicum TaxID=1080232 RepID=UPI002540E31B|nr:uncharacterized protein N7459_006920 [Penicillium hispanicum]KAJ5577956.1 hypothetical protein N7459_006920 [Penicillium hispanicum]